MKKQYLATIVRNMGNKENAVYRMSGFNKRYADSLEEAQEAIEFCKTEFTLKDVGKVTSSNCGHISVSIELDKRTYEDLKVISSNIKVREVTEWELVATEFEYES